jgi:hypothetical protein
MKKWIIYCLAFIFAGTIVSSPSAAEWSFYGNARMATFWAEESPGGGGDSDDHLLWALHPNSRIGARTQNGAIGGRFEYGTRVNLRHLYGTWDFGKGVLLVGQSSTPLGSFLYSNQVYSFDNSLKDVGQVYNGRRPMLQFQSSGFKLALVDLHAESELGTGGDVDVSYPKFEIIYNYKGEMFFVDGFAGYQTYDIETAGNDFSVDSFVYGIGGGINIGPGYLKVSIYYAQNQGEYGLGYGTRGGFDGAVIVGNQLYDNETVGGLAVVGFKLNDMVSFEAGYGMTNNSQDAPGFQDDDSAAYYVQVPITLAPGFFIIPEAGKFDFDEDTAGKDEGDQTYFGAKWQINF